eukprot:g37791.t1
MGLWGCVGWKEEWTRVCLREKCSWKADNGGEENVSGDGIPLEVADMRVNDPLDVAAGGMFQRMRGDFIEIYKILTRHDRIDLDRMFFLAGYAGTNGFNLRKMKRPFKIE